jgi:8-oxo-dGTP pyrophosphatase MutT (NUDIX family)
METKEEITSRLSDYVLKHQTEKEDLKLFIEFVRLHEGEQLFDRKNFKGHITASAFIINAEENALLLLKHKSLNRWLQPGGHVDFTDASLMDSALREAEEETGITAYNLVPVFDNIFDFDSHFIPPNIQKHEDPHYHHDVRFLFKCLNTVPVSIAEEESDDSSWFPLTALVDDQDFGRIVTKVLSMTTGKSKGS